MAAERQALARIVPAQRMVARIDAGPRVLSAREKAAVIVRYLLEQGAALPLAQLPDTLQAELAEQMGQMRLVDRVTLEAVLSDFAAELDGVGLAFPGGIEGALTAMDGHISPTAATRLRRRAGLSAKGDPWERLVQFPAERLAPVVADESVEVAAVILSKLPVPRAAEILGNLPGDRARRIAFAVSRTGNIDPETVRRIGQAVLVQIDSQPVRTFDRTPVERVGAILNVSPAATRDAVLEGLAAEDASFADQVRRAIFTYVHIATRLQARDIPKVIRLVDQAALVTAMAWSMGKPDLEPSTEFILASISQRMAQGLREEIAGRDKVKEKDAEAAMALIIAAVRTLEGTGEIVMVAEAE
jgi:flagellar motor switch protein FliG